MLKKKFRLSREALGTKRMGAGPRTPFFFLKEAPSALPYSRFAVVVSKKVEKRATRRNQIRRRFYEALHTAHAPAYSPYKDVVIHVLSGARDKHVREIAEALRMTL